MANGYPWRDLFVAVDGLMSACTEDPPEFEQRVGRKEFAALKVVREMAAYNIARS